MDELDRHPELRASDADREQTAEVLRRAAGDGRLTVDELDERLDLAYAARTDADLDRLVRDIVPRGPQAAPAAAGRPGLTVREGEDGARWVVAIMGGSDRRGRWRVGRRCTVVNLMGGADLDLNDAELAADDVELRVFSLMGGSTIRVPEGLDVEVSELAIMGGNDIRLASSGGRPGGPRLRLRIVSIMGGTDVRRGRRLSRAERRERKRLERERRHSLHAPSRPDLHAPSPLDLHAPSPPDPPRAPDAPGPRDPKV